MSIPYMIQLQSSIELQSGNNADMPDKKAKFREWFIRRWGEWDASTGRRSTQQEIADYLGVSRSAVAQYVSGRQVPEGDNLRQIARRLGADVYMVLGGEDLADVFSQFPEPLASRLRSAATEIEALLESGVEPNSPEHAAAAREIFSKYGFSLKDIDITP